MTVTVSTQFDTTQRELVVDIANMIYQHMGYKAPDDLMYFYNSQHPTEQSILACAEAVYELFIGDNPNYDDDDDETIELNNEDEALTQEMSDDDISAYFRGSEPS